MVIGLRTHRVLQTVVKSQNLSNLLLSHPLAV